MTEHNYEHLYDVPIETLNLSDEAWKAVSRVGMTTVGDCIDHYQRYGNGAMICVPGLFMQIMENEVMEKIKAHGYWQYVTSSLNNQNDRG